MCLIILAKRMNASKLEVFSVGLDSLPVSQYDVTFMLRISAPANVCFRLQVNLNVKQGGKRLEHQGIRIEFVGQIGELSEFSPWLCVNPQVFVATPPCLASKCLSNDCNHTEQ